MGRLPPPRLPSGAAMDFFFYGTLMDDDVRRLVLGPQAAGLVLLPARLKGYRRLAKCRSSAPVLVPRRGASVAGLLARGLDRRQAARLCHYEGRNYRLATCVVRLSGQVPCTALVYLGNGRVAVRRTAWRLDAWQRRSKCRFLRLATLWLAAYRAGGYETRGRMRPVVRWAARD
ncbi:MAG: gamma-glutamylcyclotransferase family protein [Alphaproteobacteria bacterium]